MREIDRFDLLSGINIPYDGICTFRSLTLNDIRRKIGYPNYNLYVSLLSLDIDKYIKITGVDRDLLKDLCIFDLMISNEKLRYDFQTALSTFILGKVNFMESRQAFEVVCGKNVGTIDRSNFENIQYGLSQINCFPVKKQNKNLKFRNEYARKLYEECGEDGGAVDLNMSLQNIIASIVAYQSSYTYENVWSLTIYQLYDLFIRLNYKIPFTMGGIAWANGNANEFDFNAWYKDIYENEKEI